MIGPDKLAEFSAVLWPALAEHLWQATIIAGLCFLALPAFRGAAAKSRHALWVLAFVRFAIPPSLVFFVANHWGGHPGLDSGIKNPLQQVSETVAQVARPLMLTGQQPTAFASATADHPEVYSILTLIWIAGCALFVSRWWFRQYRLARSFRVGGKEIGSELMSTLESLKDKLGIRRSARLRVVWRGSEPGVYGIWRLVLVLPEEMTRQLGPAEVEAVLAHELVHVARWDNLWSNMQMLVCCIFWFYPIVWLLDRCLIAERERSCDERVIGALGNSQAYASGLIKIMSIGLGLQVAGVSSMAGANLKRRIENMKKTNRKAGLPARILLSSVAVLSVLLYFVATPMHKSIAQTTPSNLIIENSENSPLKIVSATVADISVPPQQPTKNVTAHLVKPKIVIKNDSNRVVSVYVLEFRKAGSGQFYLTRTDVGLAPKGTDSIETNTSNTFLYSGKGEKVTGSGTMWTVRLDVVRFKDGNLLTLHPSPIPAPSANSSGSGGNNIVGGIPGGVSGGKSGEIARGIVGGTSSGVSGGVVGGQLSSVGPEAPPPPLPVKRDSIRIGSNVQESKLIRKVEPIYPELAKKARVQGKVTLKITVDQEGNVTDASVIEGHPLLDDAAISAVRQWKYSPTFLNGKPVPVMATVTILFNLPSVGPVTPLLVKRDSIRIDDDAKGPNLIRKVEPIYPELAKKARVQGKVTLQITVDQEGNVTDASVIKGHPLLDDAAINAVRQWKYSPTFLNGKPISVMAEVSVLFNLP
jgi:TonB family protein